MLMIKHWSMTLGYFWRPASISSKLNIVITSDVPGQQYCPVRFR